MPRIPRTALGYRPRAAAWVADLDSNTFPLAEEVEVTDLPTHSPVLGPDGHPIEYEPRTPVGFDLRPRNARHVP